MGKSESIESLSDLFINKRRQVNDLAEKFEALANEDGPVRTSGLRRKIHNLELELRSIRRQVLEAYHAQLPFWARYKAPRYWETACPIRLGYRVCGSLEWYDHISDEYYETEEQALIGAYSAARIAVQKGVKMNLKPLEKYVQQLLKDGFTNPDQGLADVSMRVEPAALPAPQ